MAKKAELKWLFIDLETTGLNPGTDQIIEIAAVSRSTSGETEEFTSLVNPGCFVDPFVQRLTGINNEMVSKAPKLADIKPEIEEMLAGTILVAHNASFDVSFLEAGLSLHIGRKYVIDTIELAKILFPQLSSYSLKNLVRQFNLPVEPCHRAMADTKALEYLFYYLVSCAQRLPQHVLVNLAVILQVEEQGLFHLFQWLAAGENILWDWAEIKETPSSKPEEAGRSESIFWQQAGWLDDMSEKRRDAAKLWQPEEIAELLAAGGLIQEAMEEFQSRESQQAMLKAVAKALEESRCLMVEAGTGVGKSLAYLIPALYWAVSQEEKVVVATHTIALQEQLYNKEIDFLHRVLPIEFQCALLKGRGNYLCLSRWQQIQEQGKNIVWGEKILLARLYLWLQSSMTGDIDSINLLGPEREWFSQIASSRETCQGMQCPYYRDCFYQKARSRAQNADLVIVNHALLLADAKLGEAVLPKYNYLIVDEAHHLEEEGTRQFTEDFSLSEFEKKVQLLHKRRDVFGRPGLLQYLKEWQGQGVNTLTRFDTVLKELDRAVRQTFQKIRKIQHFLQQNSGPEMLLVNEEAFSQNWWQGLVQLLDNLAVISLDLRKALKKMEDLLQSDEAKIFDDAWIKSQLQHIANVKEGITVLTLFLNGIQEYTGNREKAEEGEQRIYWLRRNLRQNDLTLCITPLNTADCFQQYLFAGKEAVILTSATLSVNESFDYCRQQLGISEEWCDSHILPSPFNYREQVLLLSDSRLPDPAVTSETAYNLALKESLTQILEACGGKTLVLFTSHKQLKAMYEETAGFLSERGLEVFADGINGNRHSLLEELRNNDQAIVFGASTFWEGIDLPGPALTSLVIIRLPFAPPDQPLTAARTEFIKKMGKNSFYHYSLPQAVLRFKQGYGRLIRSHKDWGVVVILDNRIINKRYGKVFLKSLPESRCIAGPAEELAEKIKDWQSRFL